MIQFDFYLTQRDELVSPKREIVANTLSSVTLNPKFRVYV